MYITLNQIKKHLNIDENFDDDNVYLTELLEVAEDVVQEHIDCNLIDLCELNEMARQI